MLTPVQALLASLRSLSISSPSPQLQVATARPAPAILAHTLISLALAAPPEAVAIPVQVLAVAAPVLPIPAISIELPHYYRLLSSSFSSSFSLLAITFILMGSDILVGLLRFQANH